MAWKEKYLTDVNEVILLIDENKSDEALVKFLQYLSNLKIGQYSSDTWKLEWRKAIYKLGKLFFSKDATQFIYVLKNHLIQEVSNKEEVEFIYSEILWNYFDAGTDYIGSTIKDLKNKYPTNPEFHHTYSHYLEKNGNFDVAINEAFLAYKIDQKNIEFKITYFNKCKHYFDVLLLKRDIEGAKKVLQLMRKVVPDPNIDHVFNNIIIGLSDRISDHELINQRINSIGEVAKEIVAKERGKLIEVLGFFSAILSFIFVNINIALSSLPFKQILLLMVGMALILGFFALLISILFSKTQDLKWSKIYKDVRLILLAIIMLIFYFLIRSDF
jgi:tetratricopeptide (TPR) repeat protein